MNAVFRSSGFVFKITTFNTCYYCKGVGADISDYDTDREAAAGVLTRGNDVRFPTCEWPECLCWL